jgi:hypothetical protein
MSEIFFAVIIEIIYPCQFRKISRIGPISIY